MRVISASSLVVTALLLLSACGSSQAATFNDTDVLNFALNLECLEAEFYSWMAYGKGLASVAPSAVGTGSNLTATSSGGVSGVSVFPSTTAGAAALGYATEVADNEVHHVQYLRTALGSLAVACPSLSVSASTFTTAAAAAVTNYGATLSSGTSSTAFNPYGVLGHFWLAAFIFEDVGVTAYKGAVSVLADATLAATASGIGSVEAGHAAVVRYELYQLRDTDTGLTLSDGSAVTYATAVAAIIKLRDTLGLTTSSSVESPLTRTATAYPNAPTDSTEPFLFAADSNAVAYTRTPKQVANIVYFSNATTPGGFYPYGVNANSALISGSAADHRCVSTS